MTTTGQFADRHGLTGYAPNLTNCGCVGRCSKFLWSESWLWTDFISLDSHCGRTRTAERSTVRPWQSDLDDSLWVLGSKCIRDVIALLGLEDARPVSTPSALGTPSKEPSVELDNERRAVYRTAVGELLVWSYMLTLSTHHAPLFSDSQYCCLR